MSATTCPKCNSANRSIAAFCVSCNASLTFAATVLADDARYDEPVPESESALDFEPTRRTDRPKFRRAFSDNALPDGAVIEGFRIIRTVGEGGFGIVYLAWDASLERHVAIKEYMPSALAVRSDGLFRACVRHERDREVFDAGLKSFVNEARLLARFDHPALVKVFRYWEGNGTAYMAMPFYEGPTLKTALSTLHGRPSEQQLRAWLAPLLDALSVIHAARCYHRDISPDNILLTPAGPLLLDFGAARRVINDRTQVLTAILKPDFAPIEQYGGVMLQGPWTDLYALAGVVHYAITGLPPVASAARVVLDTLKPLAADHRGSYSAQFLRAIDGALAIRPEARPQDVEQFRELLAKGDAASPPKPQQPAPRVTPVGASDRISAAGSDSGTWRRSGTMKLIGLSAALLLAAFGVGYRLQANGKSDMGAPVTPETSVTPSVLVAPPISVAPKSPEPQAPIAAPASVTQAAKAPPVEQPKRTPAKSPQPSRSSKSEAESASQAAATVRPQRCAEIVQKSSLEPLQADEIAYLKRECR